MTATTIPSVGRKPEADSGRSSRRGPRRTLLSSDRQFDLPHLYATLLITVLVVLGGTFFWSVYESAGFLVPPLVGAILIAIVVTQICDAFHLRSGEALVAHVVVATLTLPGLLRLSEAKFSLPLPAALSQLFRALINGPVKLLTSPLPARSGQELLVAPVVSAWLGLVVGWLLVRRGFVSWSLAGPFFTLIVALAFGPLRGPFFVWVSLAFLGLALLYVQLFARSKEFGRQSAQLVRGPAGRSRSTFDASSPRTSSMVTLLGVVAIAGLIGPRLPGIGGDERFTLREYRQPTFDPADLPSPLAEFARYKQLGNTELFTATGATPERWRLATLTNYDGRVWSVGRPSDIDGGEFRLVGARLAVPESVPASTTARTKVTLTGLNEPWLPLPGPGFRIDFDPASRSFDGVRSTARYNELSQSLVAEPGLASGAVYEITWGQVGPPSRDALEAASFGGPSADMPASRSLNRFGDKATEFTASATGRAWEGVRALQAKLNAGYYSQSQPPGHAYGNLADMLASPESMIGNEEHYAALFGVLARAARMPVRIVVGFVPSTPPTDGVQRIVASDVSAWAEVDMGPELGWVPVIIQQDPTKQPRPRQAQERTKADTPPPQPNVLPTPEPELPTFEDPKRPDEPQKSSFAEKVPTRVLLVAIGVTSPLLLGGLFVAAVVALKTRRRAKRRRRTSASGAIVGAWEELVDRARECGIAVPAFGTFAELRDALPFDAHAEREALERLVLASDRATFHPAEPSPELRDEVWAMVDEVTRWLESGQPWLQRWLMKANPRPLFRSVTL